MSFADMSGGRGGRSGNSNPASASSSVERGIFQMNTQVATLRRLINTLGTPRDSPQLRENLQRVRQQVRNQAKEIAEKLRETQETDHAALVPKEKTLRDKKLAHDFQNVLRDLETTMRQGTEREMLLPPPVRKEEPAANASSGDYREQSPQMQQQMQQPHPQQQQQLSVEEQRHEFRRVENDLAFNQAMIEERDEGIREIQQQLVEVNEIFRDLAVLVKSQGHMIDDVEAQVETADVNSKLANQHLVGAARAQRITNSLSCWIMAVVGVALLILFLVILS
eukprot:TRINITY_DN38410_c0_g1_i1.p1 TRINITY_DN38410_c0_g1~~TRINITY_DN38410_c0_g1_i1.p1  ORF type:complete len:280 (+),score=74.74 TRINITY_DN38410_c0_g1_i1:426-1265(+)